MPSKCANWPSRAWGPAAPSFGRRRQPCRARPVSAAWRWPPTEQKVALGVGLGVSIAEFPVTLEAAQEAHARGLSVFMGAPNALRGKSHGGNLSALDALEAGVLDGLAADYSPMTMLQAAWHIAGPPRLAPRAGAGE